MSQIDGGVEKLLTPPSEVVGFSVWQFILFGSPNFPHTHQFPPTLTSFPAHSPQLTTQLPPSHPNQANPRSQPTDWSHLVACITSSHLLGLN